MNNRRVNSRSTGAAATPWVEMCERLKRIHPDFRELIKAHCPRCNGAESGCLVKRLTELARRRDE